MANNLVRRLMNTLEELPDSMRAEVIDRYGIKLLTSGYLKDQARRIVANGVKGYARKKERRKRVGRGQRIHLTSEESHGSRMKKKLVGKSSWYKKRVGEDDTRPQGRGRDMERSKSVEDSLLKTRAVLFVEQSPQGELARRMKEQLQRTQVTKG